MLCALPTSTALLIFSVVSLAACKGPFRSSSPTVPSAIESRCYGTIVGLKPGFCRAKSSREVWDENQPSHMFATLQCGEAMPDLCDRVLSCDCAELVDDFPCQPDRHGSAPWPDGRYSDAEFYKLYSSSPSAAEQPMYRKRYDWQRTSSMSEGKDGDICEIAVFTPREGRCAVEGAHESGGGITHFVDTIDFAQSKTICGSAVRCACDQP